MAMKGRRIIRAAMITSSFPQKLSCIFCLCKFLLFACSRLSSASTDTITFQTPLKDLDGGRGTLVSAGKRFELGFFPNGGNDKNRYVGIWYYQSKKTIVWVLNRQKPLQDSTGVLAITEDGNLRLSCGNGHTYWSANLNLSSSLDLRLRLTDFGNLVLLSEADENQVSEKILWQSFDIPTDTFLPGMKMDESLKLTSWKSDADPSPGSFTFQVDSDNQNQYTIMKGSQPYWKSGVSAVVVDSEEKLRSYLQMNFRKTDRPSRTRNPYNNISIPSIHYNNTRLVMNLSGQIQLWRNDSLWTLDWSEPRDVCSVVDACGKFSSCNSDNRFHCKCLPGFEPKSTDSWNLGNFSQGCKRKSQICSADGRISNFLKLKRMRVGIPSRKPDKSDEDACKNECNSDCSCQAYSYDTYDKVPTCSIWLGELNNIQEMCNGRAPDLNVRVLLRDIEPTERNCKTCGTNIIPYPLSTGQYCGDDAYSSFTCDNSTGEVSFMVSKVSYRVTNINRELLRFSIQLGDANCLAVDSMEQFVQLNLSSPFYLISPCRNGPTNITLDALSDKKWLNEVEIGWKPPPEPICSSAEGCKDWPNSTCRSSGNGTNRCLCNEFFQWNSTEVECTSEASTKKQRPPYVIFLGVTAAVIMIAFAAFYMIFYSRRTRALNRQENGENFQGNLGLRMYDSERRVRDFIVSGHFGEDDKKDVDVPFFDMECILAATENFSDANKLGRGGFGPVYKGKFPGGQEIAIKRLASGSGQGLEEFKNEVVLIAKLQHRNLVRLLGYCVDGYEKLLIYEYMPNKSLDSFIFDRTLCVLLNWELRFNIIMGIARGLLYLHHDSRLRVIHRDLKTSNVLLDEEMNPKISDFGLARIFGGKQTEATTERVVGTYGYMSPEYALDGFFSIKSDVFSFGVVVLEILSGKKSTAFYKLEPALSLLGYAWRLWKEEKAMDFMDCSLVESCNQNEFARCYNVGLLCVQEDPNDRPTMSTVLFMLGSETATLPNPAEPAFVVRRSLSPAASSSSASKVEANIELTSSLAQGR